MLCGVFGHPFKYRPRSPFGLRGKDEHRYTYTQHRHYLYVNARTHENYSTDTVPFTYQ